MNLRIAVIGVSHWHAPRYLESLVELGTDIVGVSDPEATVAAQVSEDLGCPGYTDYHDLLEAIRPDFVFAMPRHCDAATVAADVIDAGLPMAIEKPIGLDAGQVAPLAERARRQGTYVAVPLINRYSPLWDRLGDRDDMSDGAVHAHFRIINGPPDRYAHAGCGWMLDPTLSGGGPLRNLGIHAADAVLALAGGVAAAVEVVDARLSFAAHSQAIEDYAVALVAGPNGLLATIEAGYTYPMLSAGMTRGGDKEWRVVTKSAYLVERDDTLTVVSAAGEGTQPSPSAADRYRRFVADCLDDCQRGRPPIADIEDCHQAMQLLDAIYERAGAPWLQGERG